MFLPLLVVLLFFISSVVLSSGHNDSIPKVLFIANAERGQANVHLATAHALIVNHHDSIQVHFASFSALEDAVDRVSRQAIRNISGSDAAAGTAVQGITFHPIRATSYKDAVTRNGVTMATIRHAPGLRGAATFFWIIEHTMVPWTGPEYVEVCNSLRQITAEVDPALVVVDTFFAPGIGAVQALDRSHVLLSPNSAKDTFATGQGLGRIWWHYPALASAYAYPVPWNLIPANIYLTLRLTWVTIFGQQARSLATYVKAHGIPSPTDFFQYNRQSRIPYLLASSPEIEYPMTLPEHVTSCGPIYMALDAVENEDADLAAWLARAPTVLIVLGSHTFYNEEDATEMMRAIRTVLDGDERVQVLWKLKTEDNSNNIDASEGYLFSGTNSTVSDEVSSLLSTGRVRIQSWLTADPASILESGHIVCYVHHGGANSFLEAIGTGTPKSSSQCGSTPTTTPYERNGSESESGATGTRRQPGEAEKSARRFWRSSTRAENEKKSKDVINEHDVINEK
ncbi:UDP-glucoronosyl and UDP-glucosyl transferase family protein [Rasamsonia emersonii CBS 393.64]|uniref:UDP-glucoronosyl and UDP-glucosyl transferase family protein n=1 Tax=Rasamsonia emersonii (strain ATCC 16479 / CBS 393.64 / IMI 116815) TaxID=1408163 RepID=A0A0F4YTR4_RASE3|nr:UDP-glucoronosyl and UDP-glucosyl transferase family protein [Rasamsonia emersonii CBS 393.64]KKA21226.1 UDP-glucoronosyl and UDP-glucosyl transferase family protein [Rasamsonia emersonii CBS 393.64]